MQLVQLNCREERGSQLSRQFDTQQWTHIALCTVLTLLLLYIGKSKSIIVSQATPFAEKGVACKTKSIIYRWEEEEAGTNKKVPLLKTREHGEKTAQRCIPHQ